MKNIFLCVGVSVLAAAVFAAGSAANGHHLHQGLSAGPMDASETGTGPEADVGADASTVSDCAQPEAGVAAYTGTISGTNLNVTSRTNVAAARNVGRNHSSQVASSTQTNRVWQRGGETLEESHTTITCVETGR
jgi:hypothetical protein